MASKGAEKMAAFVPEVSVVKENQAAAKKNPVNTVI